MSLIPPNRPDPATRHGQREIVAATLAAGIIAADHRHDLTPAAAVVVWRAVMEEMDAAQTAGRS